jgi:hypothetical protein
LAAFAKEGSDINQIKITNIMTKELGNHLFLEESFPLFSMKTSHFTCLSTNCLFTEREKAKEVKISVFQSGITGSY